MIGTLENILMKSTRLADECYNLAESVYRSSECCKPKKEVSILDTEVIQVQSSHSTVSVDLISVSCDIQLREVNVIESNILMNTVSSITVTKNFIPPNSNTDKPRSENGMKLQDLGNRHVRTLRRKNLAQTDFVIAEARPRR